MIVDHFDEMLEQSRAPARHGHRAPRLYRRPAASPAPSAARAATHRRASRRRSGSPRRAPSRSIASRCRRGWCPDATLLPPAKRGEVGRGRLGRRLSLSPHPDLPPLRRGGRCLCSAHSGFMPTSFTILPKEAMLSFIHWPNASGGPTRRSAPSCASLSFISGVCKTFATSALRSFRISGGVPPVARRPW